MQPKQDHKSKSTFINNSTSSNNLNYCLPNFLRKDLETNDNDEYEQEQELNNELNHHSNTTMLNNDQQQHQQGFNQNQQDMKYLKYPQPHNNSLERDNKFASFDDCSHFNLNYFQMNNINIINYPIPYQHLHQNQIQYYQQNQYKQQQQPYHLQSGFGFTSQQGFNYPQLQLHQSPQNNNCIFNSFNYLHPPHSILRQPTNYTDNPSINSPKNKRGSMMNLNPSNNIINSFLPEIILTEPSRMQAQTQLFNNIKVINSTTIDQKPKNKVKTTKKNGKNNSDKFNYNHHHHSKINQSIILQSYFSLTDQELYLYIITQKGSREIQSILSKMKTELIDTLLLRLAPYFSDIMISQYGNYFSRELILICCLSQRILLLEAIKIRFVEISCNSFGTHPLQSLIEIINLPKEKEILVKCIENKEVELSLDSNGTHVIQKFISCTNQEEREIINNNIIDHIDKLIINQYGVCVLNKMINHSTTINLKERIALFISKNKPLNFILNPYANYVVNNLINKTDIVLCKDIIAIVVENFFTLSMQCFSSNVVENCIQFSEEAIVMKIYTEVLQQNKVGVMLKNTYGTFVIEKLVGRLKQNQRAEIIKEIIKLGKEVTLPNSLIGLLYK